jgi:hypothetical protein
LLPGYARYFRKLRPLGLLNSGGLFLFAATLVSAPK